MSRSNARYRSELIAPHAWLTSGCSLLAWLWLRQEMDRDNLYYEGLEIVITMALALFTHQFAYAWFDSF